MAERSKVYNRIFNQEDWSHVLTENKEIMMDFLDEYKQRKKKKGTIDQYHNDLRIVFIYIYKNLNNKSILQCKKKDFRKFNIWCQEKNMSNSRVNRLMCAIRSMLDYVEDDDDYEYDNNIAKKIKGLKKEAVRTDENRFFLSFEQIMAVREELIKRGKLQLAAMWMLFYDSGGRRNEIFQVTKTGILESEIKSSNKTNIVIGKRGKKFPLVYLKDTKELIIEYLKERGEDDIESLWVTDDYKNKRPISNQAIYDRILQISRVLSEIEGQEYQIFCHTLRHTRIEHLLQGKDNRLKDEKTGENIKYTLEQVQLFAHHSDPAITQSYAKDHSEEIIDDMFNV